MNNDKKVVTATKVIVNGVKATAIKESNPAILGKISEVFGSKPVQECSKFLDNSGISIGAKYLANFDDGVAQVFASSMQNLLPDVAESSFKQFSKAAGPIGVLIGSTYIACKVISEPDKSKKKELAVRESCRLGFSSIGAGLGSVMVPVPVAGTIVGGFLGSKLGDSVATLLDC